MMLVTEGTHKALLGAENKPSKMDDNEWNDINFCTKAMIMNEETTTGFGVG